MEIIHINQPVYGGCSCPQDKVIASGAREGNTSQLLENDYFQLEYIIIVMILGPPVFNLTAIRWVAIYSYLYYIVKLMFISYLFF